MHCVFCALCIHWITRVGDVWRRPSSVFVSYFLFLARLLLVLATCWVSPVFVWVPPAHVQLPISFGTEVRRDALFNSSCSTSGVIRCVGMDSYRILCTSVHVPESVASRPCAVVIVLQSNGVLFFGLSRIRLPPSSCYPLLPPPQGLPGGRSGDHSDAADLSA